MIINGTDVRKYRPIALNLDDEKRLNTYILEAQELEFLPLVGADKYKEIDDYTTLKAAFVPSEEIPTFTENVDIENILDGGYYLDSCGVNQHFAGLTKALAYLTYAEFMPDNQVNVTPFGVVNKLSLDSEKTDEKTLMRMAGSSRQKGLEFMQQTVNYIAGLEAELPKKASSRKYKIIGD